MKTPRTYKIPHRRRREGKTDYRMRLNLLKSGKPRFVIRKSLNSLSCQIVSYSPTGDKTLISADSSKLKALGWKGHGGNIPSAYLVGYLCAKEASKKGIKEVVPDLGLYPSVKGSRIYAALKGAKDGGIDVPFSKEILPPEEKIAGSQISAFAEKMKNESPAKYEKQFSGYLKNSLNPEDLKKHFEEGKKKIG